MTISGLISDAYAERLGWTLLHSLWEGALVAALLAGLWPWARRSSASVRYALCSFTMLVLAVLPVATFLFLSASEAGVSGFAMAIDAGWNAPRGPLLPFRPNWREQAEALLPVLSALWFVGVVALAVRRFAAWIWLLNMRWAWTIPPADLYSRMERTAQAVGVKILPRLRTCLSGGSPFVLGWLRPVIVLPVATLTGLRPEELEALLAHELAHIRRHDYLINLLQTFVETLLFYHPVVLWVGRQMRLEREHCCDDIAVAASGDRVKYARVLVNLAARRAGGEFAVAANGGSLSKRVRRLLGESPTGRPPVWPAVALVLLVCGIIVAGNVRKVRASQAIAGNLVVDSALAAGASERTAAPTTGEPVAARTLVPAPVGAPKAVIAMAAQTTPIPSAAETSGAYESGDWLGGMMHSGLRGLSIDELIKLKNAGVSPALARVVVGLYPNATTDDVIELQIHGVSPGFVAAMRRDVAADLSTNDLVKLRIHGVEPEYVARMKDLIGTNLSVEDLTKLRIHGVDPEYVERMKKEGFSRLTVEQLVRMRIAGL